MPFNVQMQLAKPAQFLDVTVRNLCIFFSSPPRKTSKPPCALSSENPSSKKENLPLHLVGLVTLAQAERAGKVAGEELDLLDVGDQSLVDGLLVRRSAAVNLLLL